MQEAIRAVVDRIRDRHNARAPAKGGKAATHPLLGDELRALRELKRQSASPFVFASERGGPFTRRASPNSSRVPVTNAKDWLRGPPAHGIGIAPTLVVAAQQQSLRIS